jgi:hypothetical protein
MLEMKTLCTLFNSQGLALCLYSTVKNCQTVFLFVYFFSIFGQHLSKNFEWLSVKLNLSSVFERKCVDQDYTLWTPNDEVSILICT